MQDIEGMQTLQPIEYLYNNIPYFLLLEQLPLLLVVDDLLVEVAVIKELHDYTTHKQAGTTGFCPPGTLACILRCYCS